MEIILAQPRGFCAGVVRAIEIVEQALDLYGPPVYVIHEIVHNQRVLEDLSNRGAIFTENLDSIPPDSVAIFSAHGVSRTIIEQAEQHHLRMIDATCPLVAKVHLQAQKYARKGLDVVIIGHSGHPEVEGTRGSIEGTVHVLCTKAEVDALQVNDPQHIAYVTQTTLSIDDTREVLDALQGRFPAIQGPKLKDICYATQNRQLAVRELAGEIDLLLVVGAQNSSNSNRLREVGEKHHIAAYLVQDADDLYESWFKPDMRVGITAGASTPEVLVHRVINRLGKWFECRVREMAGIREVTTFRLPACLLADSYQHSKALRS
ncbi:MAG: 4-hydroxy-3-methylbut-2-enyl diphosphate reductase [Pseudomonadota bacterium]